MSLDKKKNESFYLQCAVVGYIYLNCVVPLVKLKKNPTISVDNKM